MGPRIYLYRITFEGRPEWYWGIHKERKFDEHYMGSPCTHREFWKLYTPVKEILETFEYSEEGWKTASMREKELIYPYLNDSLCLNECCGGAYSISALSESAKRQWRDPAYREAKLSSLRARGKSPDFKAKMSEVNRKRWEDPLYRDWFNTLRSLAQSEEARLKRIESFAKSGHQQGHKNSMFGTMWITDGTKEGSLRIPKDSPIPEGFTHGRVCK
jgi:hypothetical protein